MTKSELELVANQFSASEEGGEVFIAFMGMPGCGKSSIAKRYGDMRRWPTFLEPEESEWGLVVREREIYGNISALTWFRNTRIVGYLQAHALHQSGGNAIVDSLFDKLLYRYMDDPSLDWLIHKDDPYRPVARQLASADFHNLPNPTHVVFVSIDRQTWKELLRIRGREFDAISNIENEFAMQEVMFDACRQYCYDSRIDFSILKQQFGTPEESADELRKLFQ